MLSRTQKFLICSESLKHDKHPMSVILLTVYQVWCPITAPNTGESCIPTGLLCQPLCFHFEEEIERDRDRFVPADRKTIQTIYWRERGEDVSLPQALRDEASSGRHLDTSTTITLVYVCVLLSDCFPQTMKISERKGGVEFTPQIKPDSTRSRLYSRWDLREQHNLCWCLHMCMCHMRIPH